MRVLTTPQEVEVWYILPALRKELAKELKKKGLTQTRIAELLHVTKAAITQYLNESRATTVDLSKIRSQISESAKRIEQGRPLIKELNNLLQQIRDTKMICEIHKKYYDIGDCDECF